MLETNDFLYSAFYYDYKGRVIQSKAKNHLGGLEKEFVQYDFFGNPLKRLHIHTIPEKDPIKEEYLYTYDHAGRLKTTKHKLNDGTPTLITSNIYDKIGRLETTSNISSVSYKYDVRSRVKNIKNTQFAEELAYSYGGNIDTMKWRNNPVLNCEHCYIFYYDNLSRLLNANYENYNAVNSKFNGNYNESFIYDKHGNIMNLKRYAKADYTKIRGQQPNDPIAPFINLADNLTMEYIGNQLKKVTDESTYQNASDEYFFYDWNPGTQTDYQYNANGAMTQDQNKGMTVSYNVLNLPSEVNITNDLVPEGNTYYLYSADGVKRQVAHEWIQEGISLPSILNPSKAKWYRQTTDYIGNKIYKDGNLDMILLGNGYIKVNNQENDYHFYVRDHLGNNRVVVKLTTAFTQIEAPIILLEDVMERNGEFHNQLYSYLVVQRTDYYPSGLPFPNMENPETQPYKYNDKEFDTMHGLNYFDYGARHYDAAIMRWHVTDPLAEKYYSWSPYSYCANNPIIYIDPDGRFITTSIGTLVGGAVGAYSAYKNGTDILAGAAEGIVAGVITGAVIDIVVGATIASGGGALVVIGAAVAAGAVGGALGAIAGDVTGQVVTSTNKGKSISEAASNISTENFASKAKSGAIDGAVSGLTGGTVRAIGKAIDASTKAVQATMSKNITTTAKILTEQGASQGTVNAAVNNVTKGMSAAGSNTAKSIVKVETVTATVTETSKQALDMKAKANIRCVRGDNGDTSGNDFY